MQAFLEVHSALLIVQALATVFLAVLFSFLYVRLGRRPFIGWWAIGWTAFALHLAAAAFVLWLRFGAAWPSARVVGILVSEITGWALIPFLSYGARCLGDPEQRALNRLRPGLWIALGAGVVLTLVSLGLDDRTLAYLMRTAPRQTVAAAVFAYCGWVLLGWWRTTRSPGAGVTAAAWGLWAVNQLLYAIDGANALLIRSWGVRLVSGPLAADAGPAFAILDILFELGIGLGMVLLLLEMHRKAEGALRASQERLELLIGKSLDIITILEADGTMRYTSPSVDRVLGYGDTELVGRSVFDFIHPDDRAAVIQTFADRVSEPGLHSAIECRLRSRDGSWRVMEAISNNLLTHPALHGIIVTARDITERRNAEAALRASDQRYRNFVMQSSEGIWRDELDEPLDVTLPEDQQITYLLEHSRVAEANDSMARMYGFERAADVIGLPLKHFLKPDDSHNTEYLRRYIRAGYQLTDAESYERDRDGRERVFLNNLTGIVERGRLVRTWGTQRDVTEHRKADEALRASDERYRAFIRNSSEGIWRGEVLPPMDVTLPEDEQVAYLMERTYNAEANDAVARMEGYEKAEDVIGTRVWRLWVRDDPANEEALRAFIRSGYRISESVSHEVDGRGHEKYFHNNRLGIVEDGKLVRIWGTQRDITERRRAQLALEEQRTFLRQVIDLNPNFILARDREGRFHLANEACARAYGTTVEDLIGRTDADFPHDPAQLKYFLEQDREVLDTGRELVVQEEQVTDALGVNRWVRTNKRALKSADNTSDMVLVVTTDITERKRVEALQARLQSDVRRAALEWRLTFDAIGSPILILDDGGKVVRLNEAARTLAGKGYEHILGECIGEVRADQPWQAAAELFAAARKSGRLATGQVRDAASGRTWDLVASLVSGAAEGELRVIVVAHDSTRLVKLQETLRKSERMSAMGQLVAGVAHEVRNPLFGMTATLDAFESRYGFGAAVPRHLKVLRSQIGRLTRLMQDLLEYGKPGSLDLVVDHVGQVVEAAKEGCSPLARERGVNVKVSIPERLPAVTLDRLRMGQVFMNLLENALQHAPERSAVTVKADVVEHSGALWLECEVADRGPGFEPTDLPHVFEPFYSRRKGGTGLGLALVQRIVEQHGGLVSAGNRPEGGASVRVRLAVPRN